MSRVFVMLRVAVRNLAAHRMRSFLAVLGIVIGVSAVIMMTAMGRGAEKKVLDSVAAFGVNLLFVEPGQRVAGSHWERVPAQTMTIDDAWDLRRIDRVEEVAPEIRTRFTMRYKRRDAQLGLIGTTPEYVICRNFAVAEGRFIAEGDVNGSRRVCVLGSEAATELFEGRTAIGETIEIDRKSFLVIGVMEAKGTRWLDYQVYVPLTTAQNRLTHQRHLDQILVQMSAPEDADVVEAISRRILRRNHGLMATEDDDFTFTRQEEYRQRMQEMAAAFGILLGGVAIVSLLVGGIGIMNVMLVTVTERTREIGIRKAVGARKRDILLQFLMESVVVTVLGGTIGVAIGVIGSVWIPRLPVWQQLSEGSWESVVTADAIVLALTWCAILGIIFGLYPAVRAARMSPVEALRYE